MQDTTQEIFNPYLEEFREIMGSYHDPSHKDYISNWLHRQARYTDNFDSSNVKLQAMNSLRSFIARDYLTRRYAWSVPTLPALKLISSYSPVVSMGCGTGYWESLLREMGCVVHAYDKNPPSSTKEAGSGKVISRDRKTHQKTVFPEPYEVSSSWDVPDTTDATESLSDRSESLSMNKWHGNASCWTEVLVGDPEMLQRYSSDWTLFLSWPPYDNPMAKDCLEHFQGSTLVYIGENGGATACDEFHSELEEKWDLVEELTLPQWYGIHDRLMIHKKK